MWQEVADCRLLAVYRRKMPFTCRLLAVYLPFTTHYNEKTTLTLTPDLPFTSGAVYLPFTCRLLAVYLPFTCHVLVEK